MCYDWYDIISVFSYIFVWYYTVLEFFWRGKPVLLGNDSFVSAYIFSMQNEHIRRRNHFRYFDYNVLPYTAYNNYYQVY